MKIPAKDVHLPAQQGIPQPNAPVIGSRRDPRSVRAEDDRRDRGPMPAEDGEFLPGRGVPQAHRPKVIESSRPRCDARAVRAERNGADSSLVSAQHEQLFAGRYVPQAHGLVIRYRDEQLAVGAEIESVNLRTVTC